MGSLDILWQLWDNFHIEVCLLLVAVCVRACFFQKVTEIPRFPELLRRVCSLSSQDACQSTDLKTKRSGLSPPSAHAKKLAAAVESLCNTQDTTESIILAIEKQLVDVPQAYKVESLAGLLQGALRNKIVSSGALTAVRRVLERCNLQPSILVGELLARCYWSLRSVDDLSELLVQLAAIHGDEAYIAAWSMRVALHVNDFPAALKQLDHIQVHWQRREMSISTMKTVLLQKLVVSAAESDCLPLLLRKLSNYKLLIDALDFVLSECLERGDTSTFEEAKALSTELRGKLPESSYCLLLRGAKTSEEAARILIEADDSRALGQDLLAAAADRAVSQKERVLIDTVLGRLPERVTSELVGNLLGFFAADGPGASDNPGETILELYKRHFSNIEHSCDSKTMRLIAEAAIQQKDTEALTKLLAAGSDRGRKSAQLIKSFANDRQIEHALKVFSASIKDGPGIYNAAADACIECHRADEAKHILQDAIDAGFADVVTYTLIIKVHHRFNGSAEDAEQVVKAMRAAGVQPTIVTYNELLDFKIKATPAAAWGHLDEMRSYGLKPNRITCSILLKVLQKTPTLENVERVAQSLNEMEDEMDEILFSLAVEAFISVNRADLLSHYLKRFRAANPAVKWIHTYDNIIRGYSFLKNVSGVLDSWQEIKDQHLTPTRVTIGCMVEALVSNGKTDEAYDLINELLANEACKSQVNAVIYCSVLKGYSHQRNFERVWLVYQEMLALNLDFSIVTYNALVDACARCGEIDFVPEIVQTMKAHGIEPDIITYSTILKYQCREKRLDDAFKLLDHMLNNTPHRPDEIMYNTLLDGCARQGLYDRGIWLLKEMGRAGVTPSNFTLSGLVKLCSRANHLERAFVLVDEISSKFNFKPNVYVYSNLVYSCIMHQDLPRAVDVVDLMLQRHVRPNSGIYKTLLQACVKAGHADQAACLLRGAFGLPGVHPKLSVHPAGALMPTDKIPQSLVAEILAAFSQSGNQALAANLMKELKGVK
mmetsp:Transcript_63916/g.114070  ORF Transcript_63916/g.114070 Transcript_63916/m.114070 type:complete len:1000 (-) Transcript_63916:89-3088(-)